MGKGDRVRRTKDSDGERKLAAPQSAHHIPVYYGSPEKKPAAIPNTIPARMAVESCSSVRAAIFTSKAIDLVEVLRMIEIQSESLLNYI